MTVGIVTGAASGMGRSCAIRVAEKVDVVLLVDRDAEALRDSASALSADGTRADVEPFVLDITDDSGIARLARRAAELGGLRSAAHAAGVSPAMAEWRDILAVDLVATARLVDALAPLATAGTCFVCFAPMAPLLAPADAGPTADPVLDHPLDPRFFDLIRGACGPEIEDPGMAYVWAKRGVHRLVRREAPGLGRVGARICSVSPGIIDTPMGRQETAARPINEMLVQHTPLGRQGHADEVAAAVAFLLSDEAGFITGTDLLVDGGVVAALKGGGGN
jgi:NAD(P)-dependent dehydrogenase (short-subunit alcohol dehydrogenase family)